MSDDNVIGFPKTEKTKQPTAADRQDILDLAHALLHLLDGERSEIGLHALAVASARIIDHVHSSDYATDFNLKAFQTEVGNHLNHIRKGTLQ